MKRYAAGQRFQSLTLIQTARKRGKGGYWLTRCDCGRETVKPIYEVSTGKVKHCGDREAHPRVSVRDIPRQCVRCPELVKDRPIRGLCQVCYNAIRYTDEIYDYERITRSRAEVLEEWDVLRSEGFSIRQAAIRLGMKYNTLQMAIRRAAVDAERAAALASESESLQEAS